MTNATWLILSLHSSFYFIIFVGIRHLYGQLYSSEFMSDLVLDLKKWYRWLRLNAGNSVLDLVYDEYVNFNN